MKNIKLKEEVLDSVVEDILKSSSISNGEREVLMKYLNSQKEYFLKRI